MHGLFCSCSKRRLLFTTVCGLLVVRLLLWSMDSRVCGLQELPHVACRLQSVGLVVCHAGLVAQHVGASRTRGQTRVSWIGQWILKHWATREAPLCSSRMHGSFHRFTSFSKPWWVEWSSVYHLMLLDLFYSLFTHWYIDIWDYAVTDPFPRDFFMWPIGPSLFKGQL